MKTCGHLATIAVVDPSDDGCHECLATGGHWVHLRMGQQSGSIGCCDSAHGRHATKHYQATGDPLMRSFGPHEKWFWCYPDGFAFELNGPAGPAQS